ncbi:hypothetical protein [Klebsiella grimontii]|jgi:hypothetical protein|uniref:hypothetical protein n=1 Tax=Klebsiella grimontii TaxID=2058152 RepID=UPI001F4C8E82|nr:hypothetical protein [Klebsiella grimontii]UNF15945.1 hypothetical protein L6506_28625 [Klebsiella grimontii]
MSDKMVLTPIQRLRMLREKGAVLLPSLTDSQRAKALYIQDEPSEIACKNEQHAYS